MSAGKTISLAFAMSVCALAADPFVGSWKTKDEAPPAPSRTMQIEPQPYGLKTTLRSKQSNGSMKERVYEQILDGHDHPYTDPDADSISYRRVDSRHIECVMKSSGKPIGHCQMEVSPGENELTFQSETTVRSGKPYKVIVVYRRQ